MTRHDSNECACTYLLFQLIFNIFIFNTFFSYCYCTIFCVYFSWMDVVNENQTASGKTDSFLGGPITELTSLAAKLCNGTDPAIVLETDNW